MSVKWHGTSSRPKSSLIAQGEGKGDWGAAPDSPMYLACQARITGNVTSYLSGTGNTTRVRHSHRDYLPQGLSVLSLAQ
jgi:hypothetical protein